VSGGGTEQGKGGGVVVMRGTRWRAEPRQEPCCTSSRGVVVKEGKGQECVRGYHRVGLRRGGVDCEVGGVCAGHAPL
jgi:hypothetical protein